MLESIAFVTAYGQAHRSDRKLKEGSHLQFDQWSLTQIADHFGTDKGSSKHGYTHVYELYFSPLRKRPLRILELGIYRGASLKMWSKYFAAGFVTGVDIEAIEKEVFAGFANIETIVADCTKALPLDKGDYDIVIDDASHNTDDIVGAFAENFSLLRPGGLWIVEDLHASWAPHPSTIGKFNYGSREVLGQFAERLFRDIDAGKLDWLSYHPKLLVIKSKL
jgi:SAM-dependent methyltransferase